MNKLGVVPLFLLSCFIIRGMEKAPEELFKQLKIQDNNYRISKVAHEIKKFIDSDPAWAQLIESRQGCEALIKFIAQSCFKYNDSLVATLKVAFYLNLPSIHSWLKEYLHDHIYEKEKLEKENFHKLLCVDSIPFINYLHTLGINFNGKDAQGRTWLISAIISGSLKIAEYLLNNCQEFSIDINAKDQSNHTALNYALESNYFQLALLLHKNASLYHQTRSNLECNTF